jgi:hypothetical protein
VRSLGVASSLSVRYGGLLLASAEFPADCKDKEDKPMKRATVILILALTILAGGLALVVPSAEAGSCKVTSPVACPQIVAPVICNSRNHKTALFVNQCVASANCATGCIAL